MVYYKYGVVGGEKMDGKKGFLIYNTEKKIYTGQGRYSQTDFMDVEMFNSLDEAINTYENELNQESRKQSVIIDCEIKLNVIKQFKEQSEFVEVIQLK